MTTVLDPEGPAQLGVLQQRSALEAVQRVNIWEGSVSSGKTIVSLLAWLRFVATDAPGGGRLVMIGRTKDTLYRNVLSVMIDMLPAGDTSITYTKGANTAVVFGREVDILGANDATAESRIRGMTVAGVYCDELTLFPGLSFWSQLLNRMRVPGARLFATTNPDGPMHWVKTEIIDRATELGYAHWHFTLDDNPGLPAEYVAQIKLENVGLWFQRNILGLWVLAEGAIWSMWDEDRHVVAQVPKLLEAVMAIDYGTAGVFAAQVIGAAADDRLYVAREWRWDAKKERRQLTDAEYSARLRTWLDGMADDIPATVELDRILVDPSATSFITQLHRDGWQRVRGADNAVDDGIREVATLLGADRLRVHESVQGLRDEIPGYVWDPKKALHGEDAPIKANDHSCLVAGTMVATADGPSPIEHVRPGDQVWTRDGLSEVVGADCTALRAEVWTVHLSTGLALTGTGNHPVWVLDRGWVSLDTLRYGDMLWGAAVRVLAITAGRPQDVFNLRVAGAPEFFANGVLVHNCDTLRYGVRGTSRWWRHW